MEVTQYLEQLQHTVVVVEHQDTMDQEHQRQTEQVEAEHQVVEETKIFQQLVRVTEAVIEDAQYIRVKDMMVLGQQ